MIRVKFWVSFKLGEGAKFRSFLLLIQQIRTRKEDCSERKRERVLNIQQLNIHFQ